jgi:hypothetical protein
MSNTAQEIIDRAMELTPEERAHIADELLRSLDDAERREIDAA